MGNVQKLWTITYFLKNYFLNTTHCFAVLPGFQRLLSRTLASNWQFLIILPTREFTCSSHNLFLPLTRTFPLCRCPDPPWPLTPSPHLTPATCPEESWATNTGILSIAKKKRNFAMCLYPLLRFKFLRLKCINRTIRLDMLFKEEILRTRNPILRNKWKSPE